MIGNSKLFAAGTLCAGLVVAMVWMFWGPHRRSTGDLMAQQEFRYRSEAPRDLRAELDGWLNDPSREQIRQRNEHWQKTGNWYKD